MTSAAPIEVMLVEDDEALRDATVQSLRIEGFEVRAFAGARAALSDLPEDFAGVIVSDIRMPGIDGIEFFRQLRERDADIAVILVTGHGDVAMAVEAMKNGVADFLTKPFSTTELIRSIRSAAEKRALVLENRRLRADLSRQSNKHFVGSSPLAQSLRSLVEAVAPSEIDLVIEGEVGTGKSTLARLVHDLSPRRNRPFVTVDAGILAHADADLLLFGRDPSAGLSRTGLLERANGGTLFLDELTFLSDQVHSRLLAMLDSRSVLPLGAERARNLNLRIIMARNPSRDIEGEAQLSALEQRLGAIRIAVPSLAQRPSDIAELFRYLVSVHERELGTDAPDIGEVEWNHIHQHDWPGNLRELSSFAQAFVLGIKTLAPGPASIAEQRPLLQIVADFERVLLEDALRRARGSVPELEQSLLTPRKTLYDKLKRYNLRPQDFK